MAAHDETPLCEKCGAEVSGAPNAGVFGLRPSRMVYERLIERSKKPSPWCACAPLRDTVVCVPRSLFTFVSTPIPLFILPILHGNASRGVLFYIELFPFVSSVHPVVIYSCIIYHVEYSRTAPFGVSSGTAIDGRILSKNSCLSSFSWKKKRTTAVLSGKESKVVFYNELAALDVCLGSSA